MKKKIKYLKLQLKRERKLLKRRRKHKKYFNSSLPVSKEVAFKKKIDATVLERFKSELNEFLNKHGNTPEDELTKEINIDLIFSLEENYNKTIQTLALIRKSLFKFIGDTFSINFSLCERADFSGLFLLKVLLDESIKELKRLDKGLLYYKALPTIRIYLSKKEEVNLNLLANALISGTNNKESNFIPVSRMNMLTGRKNQKYYWENKKGPAATAIREYINTGLRRHHFELNEIGIGYLDGLISEILNNAEDHSLFDKWYAYGNIFETKKVADGPQPEMVGEINLAFLNFGNSIFEGFEETKAANHVTYSEMDALSKIVMNTSKGRRYTKENLFTLYALQEGNSRLKYQKPDRGTGTMKFINSFLNLGDYENIEKNYCPHLLIYSGSTMLKCDNKYKPFQLETAFYLSLNAEKDLAVAPDPSHLKKLDNRFPGTLLIGRIYLNEDHLKRKIRQNGN